MEHLTIAEGDVTWTSVGGDYESVRAELVQAINAIDWQDVATPMAALPGLGINAAIRELRLPGVDRVGNSRRPLHGVYEVLGIQANYADGPARVYLIDEGTRLIPVASHQVGRPAA